MPTPDGAKIKAPAAVSLKAVGIGVNESSGATLPIKNIGRVGNLMGTVQLNQPSTVFSISSPGPFSILAGKTLTEKITCTPDSLSDTATVEIASNDPSKGNMSVSLTCRGIAGKLSAPKSVAITGPVGSQATASFKIKNTGKGMLSGTIGGASAPYAVYTWNGPYSLMPNGTLTVGVGFTPSAKGKAGPGSMDITVDSPAVGGVAVTLKGTGR